MMIFGEESDRGGRNLTAAMRMERSKPLHNFEMPCLKWSSQKILRCMKVESDGNVSSLYAADQRFSVGPEAGKVFVRRQRNCDDGKPKSVGRVDLMEAIEPSPSAAAAPGRSSKRKSQAEDDGDHGIKAFKAQLIFDFQKAVEKLNDRMVSEGSEEQPAVAPPSAMAAGPWNTRKRRAEFNDFNFTGAVAGDGPQMVGGRKPNFSPSRTENRRQEVPGKVMADAVCGNSSRRRDREKFSAVLSRKEIEEDFMALTGKKAPRRPKKWPRNVQKDLDNLFPGLWLTEVTADMYKVPQETRKR